MTSYSTRNSAGSTLSERQQVILHRPSCKMDTLKQRMLVLNKLLSTHQLVVDKANKTKVPIKKVVDQFLEHYQLDDPEIYPQLDKVLDEEDDNDATWMEGMDLDSMVEEFIQFLNQKSLKVKKTKSDESNKTSNKRKNDKKKGIPPAKKARRQEKGPRKVVMEHHENLYARFDESGSTFLDRLQEECLELETELLEIKLKIQFKKRQLVLAQKLENEYLISVRSDSK